MKSTKMALDASAHISYKQHHSPVTEVSFKVLKLTDPWRSSSLKIQIIIILWFKAHIRERHASFCVSLISCTGTETLNSGFIWSDVSSWKASLVTRPFKIPKQNLHERNNASHQSFVEWCEKPILLDIRSVKVDIIQEWLAKEG